jgi:hypothetical protein
MTDQSIELLRQLIADRGSEWADSYEEFTQENPEFEQYWDIGVDAIRDNTVDVIVFGRECMLETIQKFPLESTEPDVVLCALAVSLDAASKSLKSEALSR